MWLFSMVGVQIIYKVNKLSVLNIYTVYLSSALMASVLAVNLGLRFIACTCEESAESCLSAGLFRGFGCRHTFETCMHFTALSDN